MSKAIGYVRVSTLEQAQEGVSLEAQERRIRARCEAEGVSLEAIYIDAGISGGRADNRPELQRALAACKRGDVLVFYSLSRLSRSTRDVLAILDQLRRQGADIVSLSEKLDTSSASGKLTFHMMAVLGEFERDIISERTRMAMLHLQRQGRYIGGHRPTGWEIGADGYLQAVPEEQRLVARALALRSTGMGYRGVAKVLIQEGFTPRVGNRFHPEQVRRWVIATRPLAAQPKHPQPADIFGFPTDQVLHPMQIA